MCELTEKLVSPLLSWYEKNQRVLPWRADREPYHVWLSEIMLQQTRVEAVKGYYTRFLQQLPTIKSLAACEDDRLQKLWEGLGYYSRVRNLKKAATRIMEQYGGAFPETYDQIRALPGIGDYTAGAIGSICFELATPAVDGNVLRVVSRLLDDHRDISSPQVKKLYRKALEKIYPQGACGKFTQALMELGATLCGPNTAPKCALCPIRKLCLACARNTASALPVKAPKKEKRQEEKTVFVFRCGSEVAVRKRKNTGLLAGLWEFPNVPGLLLAQQALDMAQSFGVQPRQLQKTLERTHVFTHVKWILRCYYLTCSQKPEGFVWIDQTRLRQDIALPTAFRMFWEEEKDTLS